MRKLILLASLALALGVLVPGSGRADRGGSNLPVKGSESGSCTMNVVTGRAHCVTTGRLSHSGLDTSEQDVQLVPTPVPGTYLWFATMTSTGANGDQMFFRGTGTSIALDGVHSTVLGHWVSTGGTGRLADANETLDTISHSTIISVEGAIATTLEEVTIVGTLSH